MRFIKSLFLRHLISYIGAILIPVLILGYLTYSIFLGYYKQTLEENKMNALSSIRSTIDMQISNIHREAFRIGATGEFSTNYQTRSYAQFLDIVHDLNTTRFANDFVFDVHYINNDLGYVYTSNSRFTYDGYALFAKSYDGFTGDQIRGAFLGLNGTAWWPVLPVNKAQDRVLTYLIPLARDGRRVRSAALFQISENELDTMAGATISGAGSKLLIADGNNTLLYSSADEPLNLPDGFWGDLSKAGANTPIHMNFEGENAASLVYSFPSAIVDLSYICIIAYDDVLRPLETLRFVFMLGLTVIAVLGSLLIFYFMKQNYAPIHSLGQLSKTMLGDAPVELGHARDALETTRLAMTAIYQSNRAATLANQRMRRESLLLGLFRGVLLDMEPFASQAHAVDMFLEGPEFRVALFFFGKRLSDQNLPNIGRYLESALNTAADAYIVEYAEDNSVIALLSGDASGMASVDGLLSELADNLRVYSSTLAIGLSERFCSLGEASAHYRQALVAAKYHTPEGGGYGRAAVSDGGVVGGGVVRVSGDGGSPAVGGGESHIVRYGEMNANMPIDAYPTDGLSTLHDAILTGDTEHIEFAIDMLLPYFQNIGSLFFIICLGYDIVNTALRAMRELNYPYFEFGRKYPELLLKSGFSSVDEIVEIVKTLSLEICNYLSSNSSGDGEGDGGARGGIGNVGAVSIGLGGASSAQSRGRTDRKQNDDGRDARDAANDADHRNGGGEWDIDESAVELDEAQAADIRIVLDYVQGHYTETSFSVKTLANDFGMSISSFSRFFKKHTNKLISNYITFLRLEKTKELLRTTTLPLAEIAEDSGYGHVSTLVRVFKQIEGITPGMYRSRYTVVPPGEQRGIRHPIKHEY